MDSLPISLMLAYFFWDYFLGHQMSHVAYASQGLGSMPAYLPFFGLSARILGVVFLIYFGYKSHWYLPVVLYALGYVGQAAIIWIEVKIGLRQYAWAISLAGVLVMPLLLAYMFYVAANVR